MSRPCPARGATSAAPCAGQQRLMLVAQVAAHPMTEVAAARMLILLVEELRDDGIVVQRIRVELEG